MEEFIRKEQSKSNSTLGGYKGAPPEGSKHSEDGLKAFFSEPTNITAIVSIMKNQWQLKYGILNEATPGFKVYAVGLFINSNKNICGSCEEKLSSLMASHEHHSFLYLLKDA